MSVGSQIPLTGSIYIYIYIYYGQGEVEMIT